MSHKQITLEFKKSLEATDYGLIVGCDGMLKGIWVPEGMDGLGYTRCNCKTCALHGLVLIQTVVANRQYFNNG